MILRCTCEHKAQDELHGKGMRAMNQTTKIPATYRCTICGKERSATTNVAPIVKVTNA